METEKKEPEKKALPLAAELSLVIPTFNESGNLRELVKRVDAALTGVAWEMIVVDDNSPDGTSRLAKEISRRTPACAACVASTGAALPAPASKACSPLRRRLWL